MKREIRKGDIVGRKSYGKDILFVVDKIIKSCNYKWCILKGLTVRIEVDSPIEDLELIEKNNVIKYIKNYESKLVGITRQIKKETYESGKILHLDGDSYYCNPKTKKSNI